MIRITVPQNAVPGMSLNVPLPDGRIVGITVPAGAAPGTTLQFPIPGGNQAQNQVTRQEQDKEQVQTQQNYQDKQEEKQRREENSMMSQQQEQKMQQHQYRQKQEKHENSQESREHRQRDRKAAELKVATNEKKFEMIGLSRRTSAVHPEGVNQSNEQRRNNNPGAVYPESAAPGGGSMAPPAPVEMQRGESNGSSLTDGHIYLCCCYDTSSISTMGDCMFCCTLACCSGTGCMRFLPWYNKRLWKVEEGSVGIIEDIGGKYVRTELPGPILLSAPCGWNMEQLKMKLSTRVQQLVIRSESKTKDNVFCIVEISLNYEIDPFEIRKSAEYAAYKVENIQELMTEQVTDIVRSKLSKLELDDAFVAKDELQATIESRLGEIIKEYGYRIRRALVTNLTPARQVVQEMNNIYVQTLHKKVKTEIAETIKLIEYIQAQADSERKYLLGKGVSLMRNAYLHGMQECLDEFVKFMEHDDFSVTWEDVLFMQLLLQYFDSQKDLSVQSYSSTLYISLDPNELRRLKAQIRIGKDDSS